MRNELLDHIKHCKDCHTALRHAAALRLIAHLISQKFTHADAHHAVRILYAKIDREVRKARTA